MCLAMSVIIWLTILSFNDFWVAFWVYVDVYREFKFALVMRKVLRFLMHLLLAGNHADGAYLERNQVGNLDYKADDVDCKDCAATTHHQDRAVRGKDHRTWHRTVFGVV